jgi:Zn-dependent protease
VFLQYLLNDPQYFISWIVIVVFSICLHELFHALAAYWQGDDTAKRQGYFTMNPLVHLGVPSLVFLVLLGLCWGACPVNPSKFRHPYSQAIVSFAGPFANLLLLVLSVVLLLVAVNFGVPGVTDATAQKVFWFFNLAALCNAALFLLNMIPLPPLDGHSIAENFVPALRGFYSKIQGVGILILFGLFYLGLGKGFWLASAGMVHGLVLLLGGV